MLKVLLEENLSLEGTVVRATAFQNVYMKLCHCIGVKGVVH